MHYPLAFEHHKSKTGTCCLPASEITSTLLMNVFPYFFSTFIRCAAPSRLFKSYFVSNSVCFGNFSRSIASSTKLYRTCFKTSGESPSTSLEYPLSNGANKACEMHESLTNQNESDAAKVCAAIIESSHPPLSWGALGQIPTDRLVSGADGLTLTTDELKRFAETVRCLFVSAYDGEGCLVWRG